MPGTSHIRNSRLAGEESGFSLIELLVTLLVIGALLAIAVPSYLGFTGRADRVAAQSNLRTALPALAAYHVDHGSYAGVTLAALQGYDLAVSPDVSILSSSSSDYCLRSTHDGESYYQHGPSADIVTTACS